jgi:hypothetical protein
LYSITSPKSAQRNVEAYALENDQQILFYSVTKPVTIHPMQVMGAEFRVPEEFNSNELYALWVTPSADSIVAMIPEIAAKLPNGSLQVYQQYEEDATVEESVQRVVQAVYEVLQSRKIAYVENTSAGSLGQRINYPVETLRKKQGICIETVVLFASVLESLGFDVILLTLPTHIIVGWYTDEERGKYSFLETTLLASNEEVPYEDAVATGVSEYIELVEAGLFETGEASFVKIRDARENNIMPNNIP